MRNYVKKKPLSKAKQYRQKFGKKRNSHKVHYFRLRQTNTAAIQSNGVGQVAFAFSAGDPSPASNWTAVSSLFDQVRVCAYKATFTPYIPNQSGSTVGPPAFTNFAATSVCFDYNDSNVAPVPTFSVNMQYENSKMKNLYMPWSYYVKMPKYTQYTTNAGVNTAMTQGGFFKSDAIPNIGRLYISSIGLTANVTYGSITHTWYIKAKTVKA